MKEEDLDLLSWVHIETFGLDRQHPILEVGIRVTNLDLVTVAAASWLVWEPSYETEIRLVRESEDQWVYKTHTENDLFHDAREAGIIRPHAVHEICRWMRENDFTGLPMCGNSLSTDKTWLAAQMPDVLDLFHYRIIDCSTIKELCRRYASDIYAQLPNKSEQHRVEPDLIESIEEFRFYRDNFLWDCRP